MSVLYLAPKENPQYFWGFSFGVVAALLSTSEGESEKCQWHFAWESTLEAMLLSSGDGSALARMSLLYGDDSVYFVIIEI